MKSWKVIYTIDAKKHIESAIEYYNSLSIGLGKRFYIQVKLADSKLKLNPYFQLRYNSIRCLPLDVFPYMLHYEIDEEKKIVKVYAVICTLMNPDEQWIY